jgi:hypothetical protein
MKRKAAVSVDGTSVNLPELRGRPDSSGPVDTRIRRVEIPKERLIADQAGVTQPNPAALAAKGEG